MSFLVRHKENWAQESSVPKIPGGSPRFVPRRLAAVMLGEPWGENWAIALRPLRRPGKEPFSGAPNQYSLRETLTVLMKVIRGPGVGTACF